jgi:hypothetical protein
MTSFLLFLFGCVIAGASALALLLASKRALKPVRVENASTRRG